MKKFLLAFLIIQVVIVSLFGLMTYQIHRDLEKPCGQDVYVFPNQ